MRRESAKNTFAWALFVVLIVTLVLVTPTCEAANHFVRSAATGTATGADWTNAFTDLPAHLTRGDVYYVAVGTYSHHLFNDADSGTSVIEIRAATTADHGAATDWQTTFQGEALFSPTGTGTPDGAVFEFLTDYYLINGNGVRNADWQGGYLIRASDRNKLASESVVLISQRSTFVHDITIDYVNMEGSYAAVDTDNHEQAFESRCGAANVAVRHSYLHDTGADIMFIKGRHDTTGSSALCNAASNGAQMTIEYNYLARDYSSSALHGQGLECDEGQYCVIRYNRFRDIGGTAFIATPSGGGRLTNNIDNQWDIYGNVFELKTAWTNNGAACSSGGVIQCFDTAFSGPLKFYNNTMVNINTSICANNSLGAAIFIDSAPSLQCNLNAGLVVQNNLWYNNDSLTAVNTCSTCSSVTWDHNAYFTQAITDTDGTKQVGSGNPFVGSATDNFRLAAATSAGVTLPAPYNTDMDGTTRAVDGVWDRGAFEFDSGKRPPLPPPKVALVIH